ncbi:MAG: 16S rRNA processing protein RimM [Chloroflexi bacterium]|nr:ribosome maturation factor RimM [Chloroflexota bacterium]MQC26054.1 16S rRNA processing protein RimM [Chloroflexota bacterium]
MSTNRQRIAARRRDQTTGSLNDSEPVFLAVGKVRRPHGLRGEVLVHILSDFPERLQPGAEILLGEEYLPVTIRSRRHHNDGLLIAFEQYSAREQLDAFRNQVLYIRIEDLPKLDNQEYYHHQLIGLDVWAEGQLLGKLSEIIETGANDVYVVRSEVGNEVLLPATSEVILGIDLEKKRLEAHLLPGLTE